MPVKYNTPVGASSALAQATDSLQTLQDASWDLDYIENTNGTPIFGVLHRSIDWCSLASSAIPSLTGRQNVAQGGAGSQDHLAAPAGQGVPIAPLDVTKLPTLTRIRRNINRLVFAIDTEFCYPGGPDSHERLILTWQATFVDPVDESAAHSLVFFSVTGKRLEIDRMLAYCLTRFDLIGALRDLGSTKCPDNGYRTTDARVWTVPLFDTKGALWNGFHAGKVNVFRSFGEARAACGDPDFRDAYETLAHLHKQPSRVKLDRSVEHAQDGTSKDLKGRGLAGFTYDYMQYHREKKSIPVTVLCHAGKADLSSFDLEEFDRDILRRVSDVQGGLVSMQPFPMDVRLGGNRCHRFIPLDVVVRDTMCFAAAGHKSLAELGEAVGFAKLDLLDGYSKDAMDVYLEQQPEAFMEYASRDTEVTLKYASTLFGENKDMPVTASSAAVRSIIKTIKASWGLKRNEDFDLQWRGVRRVEDGWSANPLTRRLEKSFRENVPISAEAEIVQLFARNAYKGGANGCSMVGWVSDHTFDLDLCSAYPTAMSCVFDVDWTADQVIVREWVREWARLQDFRTPFDPIWAYVDEFEFPADVPYPCIALNIDGCITFPRTLGERDGVYVSGVEIYTALKLGARIHINHGYQASFRIDDEGKPTRSLYLGVQEFVRDRTTIKKSMKGGQQGLEVFEKLEKTMVNSAYGKTAQNVVEKSSWNAMTQLMEDLGTSRITSPTHASMTTAIVRCVLMAAMNELCLMGYKSFSFTTDGFITTADEDTANRLDLCGMAPYLRQVRLLLSGSDKVWEAKHEQDEFYNLTTRGNISPNTKGVCAHNSYVSPHPSGSLDDRLYCLDSWLNRNGKVDCTVGVWAKFRDMADAVLRDDFFVVDKLRHLSMDFDLKRKPMKSALTTVHPVVNGTVYEVCNVDTMPYDTPEEYELYKSRGKSCKCLRTEGEWRAYLAKVQAGAVSRQVHITDWEWSRVRTCVMGHRLGVWTIPKLNDESLSVQDKCDWINGYNGSAKVFKPQDWKNARRQERICQMLDRDDVADLLDLMSAVYA